MSNKDKRTALEMVNLFEDPRFVRKAWRSIGAAIANRPAVRLPIVTDKDGNQTFASQIEEYSYNKLAADLRAISSDKTGPTELEMIMQCQFIRARFDTQAAVFIRDTIGGKPVDETKMDMSVNNPYESLTDEELELLAKHRESKALNEPQARSKD